MIILQTERLIIRDHNMNDLESHHRLLSNSTTMNYIQEIQTHNLEESERNLQEAVREITNPQRIKYFFRVELKSCEHVGEIGYTVTEFTEYGKVVLLGYFIHERYWGNGYTTEALKEVIRFSFEDNDVFKITTGCLKENVASENVMKKCGMKKEGEFKKYQLHNNIMKDRVVYRLLREEYFEENDKTYTSIYLIRHAHSVYTPDELNRPLSEKGSKDAEKITKYLLRESITKIVSSPYKRAVQTVEGLAKINGLDVIIDDALIERKLAAGHVEDFENIIVNVWKDLNYTLPGGESGVEAQNRGVLAIKKLLKVFSGENIAVGTHGNIMVLIMNYFDKKYGYDFWKNLNMPDIYKMSFAGERLIKIENLWYKN